MGILLDIHSFVRWLIAAVGLAAVVVLVIGLFRKGQYGRRERGLVSAYSGLIDLQVLLGLLFFLWNGFADGSFPLYRWEHLAVMILAAAASHYPSMRKKAEGKALFVNGLVAVFGSLLLILVGILLLPGGPIRWQFPW